MTVLPHAGGDRPDHIEITEDPAPGGTGIDLSSRQFWSRPLAEREAAFEVLRERPGLAFFAEPDPGADWMPRGPGYYAVTRTAIEEIVRWSSPVVWMRRTVASAATLGGQHLDAGAKVVLFYNSANRDAAVFDRPHDFDLRRQPNSHLGFGAPGPHYCLGAHLARREIALIWQALLERTPSIVATQPPERLTSSFINGIKRLPCEVSPC